MFILMRIHLHTFIYFKNHLVHPSSICFPRTALHWACKKGYLDVAALLLKNGADKNARSEIEETAASLCSNPQILYLLAMSDDTARIMNDSSLRTVTPTYVQPDFLHATMNPSKIKNSAYDDSKVISSLQDGSIRIDISSFEHSTVISRLK